MNTRSRRLLALLALIVGAVVGFAVGSAIHYQTSLGGLGGALAAGMSFMAIAIVVVVMAVTALVAGLTHRRGTVVVIGAIAVGLFSGGLLGNQVGPTYREPTTTTGSVKVDFTTPTTAAWNGAASCTSVENGTAIAFISARDVATLDRQVVWLRLDLGNGAAPAGLVVGQPLDEERTPPFAFREYGAAGPSLGDAEFGPDHRTGKITFTDLALITGPPLPLDPPARHLAGRVEWDCRS